MAERLQTPRWGWGVRKGWPHPVSTRHSTERSSKELNNCTSKDEAKSWCSPKHTEGRPTGPARWGLAAPSHWTFMDINLHAQILSVCRH